MKIGFIIYGSLNTISGGYLYDRKLVEYLQAQGDTVEIISLPWRNYAAHLADNLTFRLPPGLDILVQDELNHPSLLAANRGTHSYPVISLVHHLRCSELRPAWQNTVYRRIEKKYLQSVDGFIFNSGTTLEAVTDLIGHRKPSVIAHPPTDRFGTATPEGEIRDRAKIKELRILFLGNVIHRKGLHTLLKAVSLQQSALRVDVVGSMNVDPKYAKEIHQYVIRRGLSSIVTFHGTLDNEPLANLYKQSHLLVVPSSYEGFGIVYLEGMGFGLPAIGTTQGAAGEIITDGENGYLIGPDDVDMLSCHIDELARNRDELVRLSLNAVKHYVSQPKWIETAKGIRDFLRILASDRLRREQPSLQADREIV